MATLQNSSGYCYRNAVSQLLRRANSPVGDIYRRLFARMDKGGSIDPIEANMFCDKSYTGPSDVMSFLRFVSPDATIVELDVHINTIADSIKTRIDSPPAYFMYVNRRTRFNRVTTDAVALPPLVDARSRRYQLIGYITHIGTRAWEGHYCAIILHGSRWWRYDDDNLSAFTTLGPSECVVLAAYDGARS